MVARLLSVRVVVAILVSIAMAKKPTETLSVSTPTKIPPLCTNPISQGHPPGDGRLSLVVGTVMGSLLSILDRLSRNSIIIISMLPRQTSSVWGLPQAELLRDP